MATREFSPAPIRVAGHDVNWPMTADAMYGVFAALGYVGSIYSPWVERVMESYHPGVDARYKLRLDREDVQAALVIYQLENAR